MASKAKVAEALSFADQAKLGFLGEAFRERLRELDAQGLHQSEIARITGVAQSTVSRHMKTKAQHKEKRPKQQVGDRYDADIVALRSKGLSCAQIARRLDIGETTMNRRYKKLTG